MTKKPKSQLFIGVDPGYEGAIISLDGTGAIAECIDMPVVRDQWNRAKLNFSMLAEIFGTFPKDSKVYIEKVHAMPGQGVVSMFNFGLQFGALQAFCAANGLSIHLVEPKKWKTSLNLIGKPKDAALDSAKKTWPTQEAFFTLKKHTGRADAALIAYYGKNLPTL